jgi:phosphoribosylamine--glycine ligase
VVGAGATVRDAQSQAYRVADQIRFKDAHYRRDIGHRAIARGR